MKRLLTVVAFFATVQASAQQVNPVPDYVFRNQMSVGRNAVTDTGAYFSIGPRYGAVKGFMPPIVSDTASVNANKRNGLLIFSVQKNKFLYWDSVRVQWSDMAGSSGSYITGKGITGYVPQYTDTATLDTSALYTLGNQLGVGTSSFAYTGSGRTVVELNGTTGGLYGFKRNDSAKGYLFHNGDNMELANTVAGSISFNTNSATRGSIASDGVWRLHGLAGTGDRVVVASSNGTLSAASSATGLVDTLTISTRAWRQKGIDSVVSIIPAAGVGGSGTTNYVPKFTASSTIGNSQIFDNGTNVGIGTSSPSAKLHVIGEIRAADATSVWKVVNSSGVAFTGTSTAHPLAIITSDAERLRVTSGGNVGIGDASPTDLLVVNGRMRVNGTNRITFGNNSGGYAGIGVTGATTGNLTFNTFDGTSDGERLRIFANGRVFVGASPTDAGYQFDVNGTLRSVNGANFATTSGNVGIGTASPAEKLEVVGGNIQATKTSGEVAIVLRQSTTNFFAFHNATDYGLYANDYGTLFGRNKSTGLLNIYDKLYINSNSEVLINTTSDAGDYKLQVSGNIYNTGSAVLAATSGNVGIGTTSATSKLQINTTVNAIKSTTTNGEILLREGASNATYNTVELHVRPSAGKSGYLTFTENAVDDRWAIGIANGNGSLRFLKGSFLGTLMMQLNSSGEVLLNSDGTDAGDYKLQVVGNARIGTGKLDIASNTTFGLGVARSGTSEVAGQIYNSNGILYLGAESSAGGQIFTGSSAYAAVIGSGANYPLQFATNNATRATINTNGELLINTTTDNGDFKLQVNGNALISGSIKTANGTSSTAVPWHLGSVVATSVQLDTANYVEVEINGTFYRLAIVTPL